MEPATHVARDLGMSRATLYLHIAQTEVQTWTTAQDRSQNT